MDQLFQSDVPLLSARVAQVALEQSVDVSNNGLTYAIPEKLRDLQVGQRVVVPLGRGNKEVMGYVVELVEAARNRTSGKLKTILSRDPRALSLPAELVELAKWIAVYYVCPLGMVFSTMMPAAMKKSKQSKATTWVEMADFSGEKTSGGKSPTASQKKVLEALTTARAGGEARVEMKRLADLAGIRSVAVVKQLVERGRLIATEQAPEVPENMEQIVTAQNALNEITSPKKDLQLSESQQKVVDEMTGRLASGFSVNLLHGVTGSGKTEVYLRMIEAVLARKADAGVIVLVPEIALTKQTVERFVGRFAGVAVLHSGLTNAQRHGEWQRIRSGLARIVVGARSAIFAPLTNVQLIIVDEEHESSYKQDQLPRYNARDVAIKRAQSSGAMIILGSATPSLESYANATGGIEGATAKAKYHLLKLPERVAGFKLPKVEIVDLGQERSKRRGIHLLSQRLDDLLGQTLKQKKQAMLLLNRRGYANYIACPDHRCGWLMHCDYCDATMVYHKAIHIPEGAVFSGAELGAPGIVRCHHCDAQQMLPRHCPLCQKHVTVFGLGTQRVEEEIARKYPGIRMLRMDSDTMRSSRDYHKGLDAFSRGEIDLIVGTQMIAKGLDFPNVLLVGVISGDTALHMPDFRASERTFQLISQVAGRAGRGAEPGIVVVQTFCPDDPAIVLASKHDYETFAAREMQMRFSVGLPPKSRMARVVCRDMDHVKCNERAVRLAGFLAESNHVLGDVVRVRGPMPCPIARVGGFHRIQIEMLGPDAGTIQKLLAMVRAQKELRSDGAMAVDVDPVSLL